jgi:hypothetical protein
MTATPYIECSLCDEAKPIHRELVLTNREGLLLDKVQFCRDCWNDIRQSVEDASGLVDHRIKLSRIAVRHEISTPHGWVRLASGYLKHLAITADGKLGGMTR